MTTRGAPVAPLSAITLGARTVVVCAWTRTCTRLPVSPAPRSPTAITGMRTERSSDPRTGSESLTITAAAPARCAPSTFARNVQPPRRTSAISPRRNAWNDARAQPVPVLRTVPAAEPLPENRSVVTSYWRPPGTVRRGDERSRNTGWRTCWTCTRYPAARRRPAM